MDQRIQKDFPKEFQFDKGQEGTERMFPEVFCQFPFPYSLTITTSTNNNQPMPLPVSKAVPG